MINRRYLLKALTLVGVTPALALAPPKKVQVTTLEHTQFATYDKVRWEFSTYAQAEEFVRSLIPELASYTLKRNAEGERVIRSGYRGAVRFISPPADELVGYQFKIVSTLTNSDVEISDFPIWNCLRIANIDDAWSALSNIRIDGRPVSRNGASGKNLSSYLSKPFRKGNPTVLYED